MNNKIACNDNVFENKTNLKNTFLNEDKTNNKNILR